MPKATSSGDEQPSVRLKPLFGIAPRRYLPVIYAVVLLILLFVLLLVPGIANNGEVVTFRSTPSGAQVFVDGVRIGATPLTEFVEAGAHSLSVERAHFRGEQTRLDIRGRLFGSLIFPSRRTVDFHLSLSSPRKLAEEAAREFSRWSLVGDATAHYQFPPVLSDAVIDLVAAQNAAANEGARLAEALVDHAAADVRTPALLKDWTRASFLSKGGGAPPSGFAVGSWISELASHIEGANAPSVLIENSLPNRMADRFAGEEWFSVQSEGRTTALIPHTREGDPLAETPAVRTFQGVRFRRIPAGEYVMGLSDSGSTMSRPEPLDVPHVVAVGNFYLMESEVTEAMYAAFLSENPRWRPANRDQLISQGLAAENYLNGWSSYESGTGSDIPVVHVSYHAAKAFAQWFGEGLPDGFTARLPREAEWEWSAYLNGRAPSGSVFRLASGPSGASSGSGGAAGLYHMLGNVWEWQENWYHAGSYALAPAAATVSGAEIAAAPAEVQSDFPGVHRAVRGGSWANREQDVSIITRGSQLPETTSPYLGFRLLVTESR